MPNIAQNIEDEKMNSNFRFILIDDVPINNILTRRIIEKTFPGSSVIQFTNAEVAIEYIKNEFPVNAGTEYTILLLDIYMPLMDGWSFLDKFEQLNELLTSQIKIWMLSSSISSTDKARANEHKIVQGFALKPFSATILKDLVRNVLPDATNIQ